MKVSHCITLLSDSIKKDTCDVLFSVSFHCTNMTLMSLFRNIQGPISDGIVEKSWKTDGPPTSDGVGLLFSSSSRRPCSSSTFGLADDTAPPHPVGGFSVRLQGVV